VGELPGELLTHYSRTSVMLTGVAWFDRGTRPRELLETRVRGSTVTDTTRRANKAVESKKKASIGAKLRAMGGQMPKRSGGAVRIRQISN
jgi:hypothetical protein